jgi:hypothetical protein
LESDVSGAQNKAKMYIVFKATHSNKNLSVQLSQLESQLVYVIIRFNLGQSTIIPSEKDQFKEFIAKEVLKLIAFAGIVFVKEESEKLLLEAYSAIYEEGNQFPALVSLYENGRLCYFRGATFSSRLSILEAKVESMLSIKEKNSPRSFEHMRK